MKKLHLIGAVVLVLVVLTACAAGPNDLTNRPDDEGEVAGFWRGLWHGAIAPITFVISLFDEHVSMYEVHNNGGWYDFGFLFGLSAVWGGGSSASARASGRRSRDQ